MTGHLNLPYFISALGQCWTSPPRMAARTRLILFLLIAFSLLTCIVYFQITLSFYYAHNSAYKAEPVFEDTFPPIYFKSSSSHPLENTCKYPILEPEDENLKKHIHHGRRISCKKVQPDLIEWDPENGILRINQEEAANFSFPVYCYYQTFAGGLIPKHTEIVPLTEWTVLVNEIKIDEDIVRVECITSHRELVFRFAYSRVAKKKQDFAKNTPTKLSLDILVLDSTSLNMFRRHAPSSWKYMTEKMGFFIFDGYTKVADNSMVNLVPLLTGLRYKDVAPDMKSDINTDKYLDSDITPFLWHLFKAKNCVTLFNDDIAHKMRGFMNYPFHETGGFKSKPTDHFYRPWHLYHRSTPISDSSKFCFGNEPYYKQQISLLKQMNKLYTNTRHFSFNFLTDLTHDNPNELEILDEVLLDTLKYMNDGGYLNHTVLVIMGDHGNRIGLIRYSYIGRIEERTPFFAIRFPPWFLKAHPGIENNLRINQHRLATHFDAHEMFRDILEENFNNGPKKNSWRIQRGISLFETISRNRTCSDANIPVNHCVCMDKNRTLTEKSNETWLWKGTKSILTQWAMNHFSKCTGDPVSINITNISVYTTNQYIQHGVRNISDTKELQNSVKKRWLPGNIEYLQTDFDITPLRISGTARIQHNKISMKLTLNGAPLIPAFVNTNKCTLA